MLLGLATLVCGSSSVLAQTTPSLGAAEEFAVLAGSTVTAGLSATVIFGDVGVSPGITITGIPVSATIVPPHATHASDAEAIAAQISASDLYAALAGIGGATALGMNLSGLTLSPGTYSCLTTAGIAAGATLTLDGAGVYVFQVGTTLTAAALSSVVLMNGASPDQVFWQCGTTATLGGKLFSGNVVAGTTVTVGAGADVNGRLFAPTVGGTVTMAGSNVINGVGTLATAPALGDAESFAVLAGSTVTAALTNTVITGDVGVSLGVTITGFPLSAMVVPPYATHANDAEAIAAQVSVAALHANLLSAGGATDLAYELGGLTLTPGTYSCFTTAGIAVGATLTLDGPGFYVFQIGTTMTAAALSNVVLVNGATASQVFWQCGTTATLGGDMFFGTVIAGTTVTLASGSDVNGRLFAPSAGGTVTMAGNSTIDVPAALTPSSATVYGTGCGTPAVEFSPTANPIIGETAGALVSGAPTSFGGVSLGFSDTHLGALPSLPLDLAFIGMPGCELLQSNDISGLSVTPLTASTMRFESAIPNSSSLLGAHVFVQAYCLAPGENQLQMVLSNGIDWLIGTY